ncbi:39S ribosomal protein L1, mitochondrial [Strongylocentrotus purpuratus]|uniref:39S ribosomal protein L1, mitochondrial n=1 Tax=Strongylocentrotus purpuratus TaxID=7668 RepID=A0A7M7NF39_STRPU|nr:39S ribosomal protein L1, mitochondrial [Strongylocentrotus purpuratus]
MAASMSSEFLARTVCGSFNRIGFLMGRVPHGAMRVARQTKVFPKPQETNYVLPSHHSRCLFHSANRLSSQKEDVAFDDTDAEDDMAVNELSLEMKPKGYMAARPVDDVYMICHYPPQMVTFHEAMDKLRSQDQWAHIRKPELYKNRTVTISILLDMALEKKKKVVAFTNMVILPHQFKEDNKVLCFAEDSDTQAALDAGAFMVGNADTVQDIVDHRIHHRAFDYCVSTPEMMPSLTKLKEKLRKRFPASKRGSVSNNITAMLNLYSKGHEYKVQGKHNTINCAIGKLSLTNEQLEENMAAIISDVCSHKPLEFGSFIKKLTLTAFLLDGHVLDFKNYLPVSDEDKKLKEELEKLEQST